MLGIFIDPPGTVDATIFQVPEPFGPQPACRSMNPVNIIFLEIKPPQSVVSDDDDDESIRHGKVRRKQTVPTVFRWEYGGKEIYLSGSFNEWKTRIPMSYR